MSKTEQRIFRRTLIAGMAAAAVSLTVSVEAAAQADRDITVVIRDEPTGLDACNADVSFIGRIVRQNITETLTEINPADGSITPRLATSWEKVDPQTWRFRLREGVQFSDGEPFNAETAKKALDRTLNSDIDCSTRTIFFSNLEMNVTVIDDHTVEVSADQPVPILPTQLGIVMLVSPNTPNDKLVNEPVGTGPYVLDHWTPGQEIVVKQNPGYWGEAPEVTGARYVWRSESSVRAAMVEIGEADLAPSIATQDANNPAMDVSFLNSETTWLRIDVTQPPLDDKRVRLALNYAVDREGLRGSIFPEGAIPATQINVPGIAGHNMALDKKVYPFDPERARQLLAEAKEDGVPVESQIRLIGRNNFFPNAQEALEAITAMFEAVGFNIKLEMHERGEWINMVRKPYDENRGPVILNQQHDNNNGDPVFSVYPKYGCEGINSTTCDDELDKLVLAASEMSGVERVQAWEEAFAMIFEMVPDVMLFHQVAYSRVGPRLDFKPSIATNSEIQLSQIKLK